MAHERLPGILVIGLAKGCQVCEDLERKGFIDALHELKGSFLADVFDMEVDGIPPPGTPSIFIIDPRYPNFKYFKNRETYERARVSGRDWTSFLPSVRFFNRKVSGGEIVLSSDYVGTWSVEIMKRFCTDSSIQISQELQLNSSTPPKIVARYTEGHDDR